MLNTHLKVSYFGITDIGLVREHNEDVWKALPEKGLFLVADGMGGHQAGEIAAQKTITSLSELIKNPIHENPEDYLKYSIKKTNTLIYQEGKKKDSLSGMGTTLCCLLLHDGRAILAHVGDSRIYLFRQKKLQQLTEDHSLVNELLSMNAMSIEEASHFPYKHILTKAIGTNAVVEPSIHSQPIFPGDLFLLCTDGLTNFITDEEIFITFSENKSLEQRGKKLVDLAKKHGGGDNITALLVAIEKV